MKVHQIHVGQSMEGVQQFLDAHDDVLQSVNQSDARKELDVAVAQFKATAAEQDVHVRELKGVGGTRVQGEAVLLKKFMTPLSKWARANLQGQPALAALTPSAGHSGGSSWRQRRRACWRRPGTTRIALRRGASRRIFWTSSVRRSTPCGTRWGTEREGPRRRAARRSPSRRSSSRDAQPSPHSTAS